MSYSKEFKKTRVALSRVYGYKRFPATIASMPELIKRYNTISHKYNIPNLIFPKDALKILRNSGFV